MKTVITAQVIDQTLIVTNKPKLASGGVNEHQVELTFSNHWDGYGLEAVFWREKKRKYRVVLVDGVGLIPWEVTAEPGEVHFSIRGAAGTDIRTTEEVILDFEQGPPAEGSHPAPLPDVYRQVLSAQGKNAQDIKVERARLDAQLAAGTVDGEVEDLRVGADGKTYGSAGTAVRAQVGDARVRITSNGQSLVKNQAFDYESIEVYNSTGYVIADGSVNATETDYHCKYTQPIPCMEGDVFSYVGVGQFNAVSYVFYSDAGIVATGAVYSANAVAPKTVTVPAGVSWVVFASYARTDTEVLLEIKYHRASIAEQIEGMQQKILDHEQVITEALTNVVEQRPSEILTPEWTEGYYYARDGRVVDYATTRMGRIRVYPGDTLRISGAVWASTVLYAFTDNIGVPRALYPATETIGEPTSETVTVQVPKGAVWLYVNDITPAKPNAAFPAVYRMQYAPVKPRRDVLEGKTYVAVGDSYTEGDFSGWSDKNGLTGKNSPVIYDTNRGMYKTYPWWIAERNNMNLLNYGKCGSIVALDKDYLNGNAEINSRDPLSLYRYQQIPGNADYVTFWFGINDAGHTNLGTIDDTDNTTFYGAWNVVLPYLIQQNPHRKMGIIVTTGANSAYRQATRDIARKWGIPYLDLTGDDRVPLINGREENTGCCATANDLRKSAFMLGNGHPTVEAHEYISTIVENFLRSL